MLNWLIEPLGFEFMRNAIAIGVLIGILSAVIGSYLIVQHMGLLGDVVAHAVLPGLAIAFYIGMDIFLGAFIAGTISTFVVAWIQTHSKIKVDTAMALVFSGFLALGVMLITTLKSKLDLHSFLFGDILGVTSTDLWRTLIIAIAVLSCVAIFYRELIFYCFDPLASKAMGLPVHF
ncbi:MAG: metal ABC transporter permease, partial [Pseudanabaena sp.]